MKIETKYNIGDTVYFTQDDDIYKGVVNKIFITIMSDETWETYEVEYSVSHNQKATDHIHAECLFESAKALYDRLNSISYQK